MDADTPMREPAEWLVTELLGEEAKSRGAEEAPASPAALVKRFFEWQFQLGAFDFAIIAGGGGWQFLRLIKRSTPAWVQILLNADDAKASETSLQEAALRGFELLFATISTTEEVKAFFARYGYRHVGTTRFGSGEDHDPLRASWNRPAISRAVALASRMRARMICCFAHDADPVYLLSKET